MYKMCFILLVLFVSNGGFSQNTVETNSGLNHDQVDGEVVKMIPFRKGKLYGFVEPNKPSQFLIQPIYKTVAGVYAQGAIVSKGKGFGLININNEAIIPLKYDQLTKDGDFYHAINFNDETEENKFHHFFYNLNGELVFSQASNNKTNYNNNNYAWFDYQGAIIVKDMNGFAVSRFPKVKRQFCLGIHNDLTCFRYQKKDTSMYKAFTSNGDVAFEIPIVNVPWYKGIIQLSEDFYMFESSPNNRMFHNQKGEVKPYRARLSHFEMNETTIQERGCIRVGDVKNGVMGVVDLAGDTIIPFKYSRIYTKVNDRYIAIEKETEKKFVLNEKGERLTEIENSPEVFMHQQLVLREPVAFFDGLAVARKAVARITAFDVNRDSTDYFFSYFNEVGKTVFTLDSKYTFVSNFSDGMAAIANSEGKLGFVNKQGEILIEPQFEFEIPKYGLKNKDIPKFIGGFAYIPSVKGFIDKKGQRYYSD